jgi:hypothetical protein
LPGFFGVVQQSPSGVNRDTTAFFAGVQLVMKWKKSEQAAIAMAKSDELRGQS